MIKILVAIYFIIPAIKIAVYLRKNSLKDALKEDYYDIKQDYEENSSMPNILCLIGLLLGFLYAEIAWPVLIIKSAIKKD